MVITMGNARGFTLIELMIVVVVVAILAAIAYPSYQNYLMKAKRADAHSALLRAQLELEKWRVNHTTYTTALADLGLLTASPDGHYSIAITIPPGAIADSAFSIAATPQGSQIRDTGCSPIRLTVLEGVEERAPADCW